MTKALPFRLNGETQKKAFDSSLAIILSDWMKTWVSSLSKLKIDHTDNRLCDLSDGNWMVLGEAPDYWLAWKLDSIVTRELLSMMFNSQVGTSNRTTFLMKTILTECIKDLAQRVFALGNSAHLAMEYTDSLALLQTGYGSGAITLELKVGSLKQPIIFGGGIVQQIAPITFDADTSVSLSPREETLDGFETTLEITVGTAQITLKDVANIEVGDVIRLDTVIQEPFAIRSMNGLAIANGHLGVNGKLKAVKFVD